MKYIKCIECHNKVKAKRIDKKYCKKCLLIHYKLLRRIRDRNEKSKLRYKRYRNTDKYREKSRKRYFSIPIEVRTARYYVTNATRDGILIRPEHCQKCKIKNWGIGRSMIEAHHHKGYSKENRLNVIWLCSNCHKLADKEVMAGEY